MPRDDEKFKLAEHAVHQANTDGAERTLAAGQVNATLSVATQLFYLREEVSRLADALEALQPSANASERIAGATESLRNHVEAIKYDLQNRR